MFATVVFIALGLVLGVVIAGPTVEVLGVLVEGKSALDDAILKYVKSLELAREHVPYVVLGCAVLIVLGIIAYRKLDESIERDATKEAKQWEKTE